MAREYSDIDYYWEKAEFQDPLEHRRHVDSYKRGFPDSYAFDDQYRKEALNELYEEYKHDWREANINSEPCVSFDEWYSNVYSKMEEKHI